MNRLSILQRVFTVVAIVWTSFASSCNSLPVGDAPANRLVEVLRAQEAAWNAGDIEGFMSKGYWNSPDLNFLSGGSWTRGYQPVLERYRARYKSEGKEMGVLSFTDLDPQLLSNDAGFVRGKWRLDFKDAKPMSGLFTLILRRFPEGWRIVNDHTSVATE